MERHDKLLGKILKEAEYGGITYNSYHRIELICHDLMDLYEGLLTECRESRCTEPPVEQTDTV